MKKREDSDIEQGSGLFIGSESIDGVHDRRTSGKVDDDRTDTSKGDTGDDDATDSDKSDSDTTDKGDGGDDSVDADGKD